MERVEGKDLGSSLARAPGHRLPPLLAAFVAAECCQALDYAHQRKGPDGVALGIVHRDVTPRNVLLSWSGEVKLTDFGIAALAGDATSRLLGTPQYMAPEQARSEPIDPRADIYAIGLVLREAILGVRPRPGTDRDAILEAARRGDLLPWPAWSAPPADPTDPADPDLALGSGDHGVAGPAGPEPSAPSEALVEIVQRATAATAADRYPDARSMLEALDAFIVADRAAHKAESPARQLALWLSVVWDGAREDAESDAAIDAEHLVSFLDDGAVDLAGTGTMRSLALTAADGEGEGDPPGGPATGPATAPTSAAPASGAGKPTVIVAVDSALPPVPAPPSSPETRAEAMLRMSRISSSSSTVASGTFQAIGTRSSRGQSRARRSRLASPISLVVVAVVTGATVFWVMNRLHAPAPGGAAREAGSSAPPVVAAAAPGTGQGSTAPPSQAGAAAAGSVPSGPDPSAAAAPAAVDAGLEDASAAGARPDTSGGQKPGPATPRGAIRPALGHPVPAPAGHVAPGATPGATTASGPVTGSSSGPAPGSADGSAAVSSSDRLHPATCRVRINLTPWAYYTADDDGVQHETPGTIDLTPGPHRLHVWNPELHVARDIVLTVPADRETMNYSEPLQPTSLHSDAGLR
jgi:serine/threonine protein kinase